MKYKFKGGDIVQYDLKDGIHSGLALVEGCVAISVAVLGRNYVIRPLISIRTKDYPFDCCSCFESNMVFVSDSH